MQDSEAYTKGKLYVKKNNLRNRNDTYSVVSSFPIICISVLIREINDMEMYDQTHVMSNNHYKRNLIILIEYIMTV